MSLEQSHCTIFDETLKSLLSSAQTIYVGEVHAVQASDVVVVWKMSVRAVVWERNAFQCHVDPALPL